MLTFANDKDTSVVIKMSQGDAQAFSALFKKYASKVFSLGLYLTKSHSLAEEIVQDVFIKVWENRSQLHDVHSFHSWLHVVCRNTCYNYLRKKAHNRLALLAFYNKATDTVPAPQDIAELKEMEAFIEAAIQKLPPQQQKVFRLKKIAGKKTAEIAKELNISTHTVKEYLKIAQKAVKSNFETSISLFVLFFLT